ncbi:YIP1 family protein [Paraglaciecola marina]|uniref:YIP1 family protein n=1 Tax=Paraglaciecola marina TaxID=2500157 RepID=UPI00105E355D|nr:YIP1 family protein [Paraglaciecola marina]
MQPVSNPFQAMKDVFIKPNQVFATIKETHNWSWIPFIVISLITAIPIYLYFSFIDFDWYRDLVIQSTAGDLSPLEQENMAKAMNQPQLLWASLIGAVLANIIANAVLALYLNITTKSDEECVQGYTDWYGFAWWTSIPSIFTSIIALIILAFSQDPQLSPISLGPTSLAFIFGLEMSSPWFSLAQSVRLESIWVMYLIAVGLSQWTQLPIKKTYIIATAPYIVIWGAWALMLLL